MLHITLCFHYQQFPLTTGNHIDYFAAIFIWNIHYQYFKWLILFAIHFFHDYLWLANCKFVTFPSHRFNQDTQVKDTTTKNKQTISTSGFFNAKSEIFFSLFHQAIAQMT